MLLKSCKVEGVLFTFLDDDLRQEVGEISATINVLEGGINGKIKSTIHAHRGLSGERRRICVEWILNQSSYLPADPVIVAQQQRWGEDRRQQAQTLTCTLREKTRDKSTPALYDHHIDLEYNHSLRIRKGTLR